MRRFHGRAVRRTAAGSAACLAFALALAMVLAIGAAPAAAQLPTLQHSQSYQEVLAVHGAIDVLVRAGDDVPGIGQVVSIGRVAINERGSWLVEVRTNHPDPEQDEAVLHDGAVAWREGQLVGSAGPVNMGGARIRRIEAFAINARGDTCWSLELTNTPAGEHDDSVLFVNAQLVLREGRLVAAAGIPPGTPYRRLLHARLNGEGDALVAANLRQPGAGVQRALLRLELDAAGALASESTIALSGTAPAGLGGDLLLDVDTSAHTLAFNAAGDALYVARATQQHGGAHAIMANDRVVAREGDPCAFDPARRWTRLAGTTVASNDAGSVLFRGAVDGAPGDADVLVLNDRVLARKGDVIETQLGSWPIRGFAYTTPLGLGNDGDTLYFAFLDKPGTKFVVAVLDGQVLLQEGVTPVEDTWIEALIEPPRLEHAALSPDASKLVLECRLAGVGEAALRVDLARLPQRFCNESAVATCPCGNMGAALAGCDDPRSSGGVRLRLVEQHQGPANRATMVASGFGADGQPSVLLRSTTLHDLPRVFGDGLLCLQGPLTRLSTATAQGGLARHEFGHAPAAGSGTFHYQAWTDDRPASWCDPTTGANLSSGRSLRWDQP